MVCTDRSGQHHSDHVGGQDGLTARPDGEPAEGEEGKQDELRLQLRDASGCPICLVGDKAVRRYQRFTLDASVNALAFRSQLTAA